MEVQTTWYLHGIFRAASYVRQRRNINALGNFERKDAL